MKVQFLHVLHHFSFFSTNKISRFSLFSKKKTILSSLLIGVTITAFCKSETVKPLTLAETEKDTIMTTVEEPPKFPGGYDALKNFIAENIQYPETARNSGISGIVYVSFVVEKDGSIGDIMVLKSIGGGCDEEAVRVIKLMPNWMPGKQKGQNVRTKFTIPINFNL